MKLILFPIFLFCFTSFLFSQENISSSGGNATGSGSSSYTVGQLMVTTNSANNGSVAQGIQQSIELFTLTNPDLKTLTLKAITYPNPTEDFINLTLKESNLTSLSFAIFDINGKIVSKGKVHKEKTKIAMRNFAKGIYLLKVNQHNKSLKVFKIIKN